MDRRPVAGGLAHGRRFARRKCIPLNIKPLRFIRSRTVFSGFASNTNRERLWAMVFALPESRCWRSTATSRQLTARVRRPYDRLDVLHQGVNLLSSLFDGGAKLSRVFAYCRVSTAEQTTDNQVVEIRASGFNIDPRRVIAECVSGSIAAKQRAGFTKLLDRLEDGDVLIVTKLDRLGRNAMDVRATVEELAAVGVRVHCLALGGADLTSAAGKMTMSVLSAVAEFERDLLLERTAAGLARARSAGKVLGLPRALSDRQQDLARALLAQGRSIAAIARDLNTSRQTVMRLRARFDETAVR